MGLPVYSVWSANNNKSQDAVKSDPTAHARSAIRRGRPSSRNNLQRTYALAPDLSRFGEVNGGTTNQPLEGFGLDRFLPDRTAQLQSVSLDELQAPNSGETFGNDHYRSPQVTVEVPPPRHLGVTLWPASPNVANTLSHSAEQAARPRSRRGPHSVDFLPPLRRMSRRNIADELAPRERRRRRRHNRLPPAPEVNGLGDRQRSWSPDSEHEHDQWETFLNTITPDPSLPSASTSFASAAASGSYSNNHNATTSSAAQRPANQPYTHSNRSQAHLISPEQTGESNANATQSRSISPMPPPYMATPESEPRDNNETQEDDEICDEVPQIMETIQENTESEGIPAEESSGSDQEHAESDANDADRPAHRDDLARVLFRLVNTCHSVRRAVETAAGGPMDDETLALMDLTRTQIRITETAMLRIMDGAHDESS